MSAQHVDPDALAALAVSGADAPAHVASCDLCRSLLEEMRRDVADLRSMPDPPASLVEAAKAYFRRRRALEALIERLAEDPALRAKAKARPDQVLREAGLDPVPSLVEALTELDRSDRELARRIAARGLWG